MATTNQGESNVEDNMFIELLWAIEFEARWRRWADWMPELTRYTSRAAFCSTITSFEMAYSVD